MKKAIIVILLIIPLITINFSGCIDVDLAKVLFGEEEKPKGYHTVTKQGFPVKHEFDSQEQDYEYQKNHPIFIKENTHWMNITFEVEINDIEFINFTNESFREIITELLNLVHRHVELTLINPGDDVEISAEYTESVEHQLFAGIENPQAGTWVISIDAIGLGYEGQFHDSFSVDVKCYEPA